ncbi:MAG: hypothetical protein ACRECP_09225 [Methylocella sp.]
MEETATGVAGEDGRIVEPFDGSKRINGIWRASLKEARADDASRMVLRRAC